MTLPLDPVRIALVGLGGHGRTIQGAADAAPGLEVVGVYDPDPAEAALSAERFGCDAAPSYQSLLDLDGLEAVSLCSPNAAHRPQAEAAFEAGLDVFVEKPIANTVADGLAMIEAAELSGRLLMVGHNMRFGDAMRWGKSVLEGGRLGRAVSVEVHFSTDTALRLEASSWRLRPDQCPLLPMMQLGVHGVDLVHYLLGPVRSVFARARAVTTTGGVVDSVAATFSLEGGALGTMVSNYCSPVDFRLVIAGTEGTLAGTPAVLTFAPRAGGEPETLDASADGFASYAAQMQAFADAVRGRTEPETHGWAGTQALAVVEAMTESIDRDAPVEVAVLRPLTHAS
ncbi:Gfo/Idh/MocA family protein [Rubrivirga sp.]|uniref:Gfo/Idh/MocA family protein n=1 Tax=Rubrivirga sp. TaxID=1885344 RepID=UPI003B52C518